MRSARRRQAAIACEAFFGAAASAKQSIFWTRRAAATSSSAGSEADWVTPTAHARYQEHRDALAGVRRRAIAPRYASGAWYGMRQRRGLAVRSDGGIIARSRTSLRTMSPLYECTLAIGEMRMDLLETFNSGARERASDPA
jgi:hypothetical protein